MNIQKLNSLLGHFAREHLQGVPLKSMEEYLLMERFQYYWDIDALDFVTMYDDSLGGRSHLWEGADYHPKASMLHYISQNPDLVRSMFIDLYDQQRDVVGRIHRFIDQCDQLRIYHSQGITKRASHYHGDMRMVFVYLALRYPAVYCYLYSDGFATMISLVDGKKIGPILDIERFIRTSNTIAVFMSKHPLAVGFLQQFSDSIDMNTAFMLCVSRFYKWIVLHEPSL